MLSSRSESRTSASSRSSRSAVRAWLVAARTPTLPAAIAPVLVGTGAAAGAGAFHPWAALAALAGAVAIQVGTNFHNDVLDFLHGADTTERRGPQRATQSGLLTPRQMLTGAYAAFGVAAIAGIYLVARGGWPILIGGLVSIASGMAYTAHPIRLGYRGLGDLFVFVFFGVVAVVGTDYVQTGALRLVALCASVVPGALATAILVANNLRDIDTDRAAGKRTLAVRLGRSATRVEYAVLVILAFATPAAMRLLGMIGSWFWLPWLTAPLGGFLIYTLFTRNEGQWLVWVLKRTARLLMIFSALFAIALARTAP
jgi:1,4-dihydroxy-2-naphthoate polyprenyltransferase